MSIKFNLVACGLFYSKDKVESLKKLGIKFYEDIDGNGNTYYYSKNKNGVELEFNSLEELITFSAQFGKVSLLANNTLEVYELRDSSI